MGAQDCFWEGKGAFTGEVSPSMLKDIGCEYVIVGHSERRIYFKETDDVINKKIKKAAETGLVSILCIGETGQERKNNETEVVLKKQITSGLEGVSEKKISEIVIAYEPIWAIGTGISCDTNEAKKAGLFIKSVISDLYNEKVAENMAILYGGSVSKENSSDYIKKAGMNGLLVGGASLRPDEFIDIVKSVE
jgi:triosephosphate isomerase